MKTLPQIKFDAPLRILVLEDNQIDRRILESMLTESGTPPPSLLKITNTLTSLKQLLTEHIFDIVILDLNVPDSKGEDTLLALKEYCPDIPIVVNTGAYEEEIGLKTLSLGAQDFLVKGRYTAYVLNKVLRYSLERKRLELELRHTYEKLKEAQNQLTQAEKMRVVGNLASGVAHEVKNPLATILYGITFLQEQIAKQDGESLQTILTNIQEAGERANTIINDLLDFASLTHLVKEKCSLAEVVDKSLSLTKHELEKQHIKIIQDIDEGLPDVSLDKNRMIQVVVNLLLNAAQAMTGEDEGTLSIKVSQAVVSDDFKEKQKLPDDIFDDKENVMALIVEDTGGGVSPADLDKIFEPFYTTRRGKGGIGLGLSVTKNIVDIHEGFIKIENREDRQGAKVSLILKIDS